VPYYLFLMTVMHVSGHFTISIKVNVQFEIMHHYLFATSFKVFSCYSNENWTGKMCLIPNNVTIHLRMLLLCNF